MVKTDYEKKVLFSPTYCGCAAHSCCKYTKINNEIFTIVASNIKLS